MAVSSSQMNIWPAVKMQHWLLYHKSMSMQVLVTLTVVYRQQHCKLDGKTSLLRKQH